MRNARKISDKFTSPAKAQYEVQVGHSRKWFIRLINLHNSKTVFEGQTYASRWNARRAGMKMARNNNFSYKEIA